MIASLPDEVFSDLESIYGLDLSSNMIASLPGEVFSNLRIMDTLLVA